MNEIQKFKQERKILKAQNGTKTYYEITEKPKIVLTKGKEESLGTYNRKIHNGKWAWGQYDGEGNFIPITKQVIFKDGTILNTNGSKSSISARNAIKNVKVIERGYIDANGNKIPINPPQNDDKVKPKRPLKDWGKEFTNFMGGLSSEQQEWLKQNGLQDATRLQEYLNNMKFNVGKFGADGKFGKDSKAAWDRFVASGIMGKNNDQEILKRQLEQKTEPLVDAPDPFGYKTSNTYEDDNFADKVRALGIKSNADLMHFMYESKKPNWKGDAWQTQFRNDVDRLLGGDYSDKNIRKVFKTKNGWNNGFMGRGDFGDFQNVLQTNAGVWNGMYDAKKEASVAKPTFNTQEMLNNVKSLKFTAPEWKFSLNQGNIGASTLGDLPSTKPINLSQEFTTGLTPNIPSEVYKPNTSVVYKPGTSDWLDWAQ